MYRLPFSTLLLASFLLTGCDQKSAALKPPEPTPVEQPDKGVKLTAEEYAVLEVRLASMIVDAPSMSFADRIEPMTGYVVTVHARSLQSEYERNEAAADQQFRNKNILLNGTVRSINRASGDSYYITLEGGPDASGHPRAVMAAGHVPFIAGLNRGDRVGLACRGNGKEFGDALLTLCLPLEFYARAQATRFVQSADIGKLLATPDWMRAQVMLAVAYASELPKANACLQPDYDYETCHAIVGEIGSMYGDRGTSEYADRMNKFMLKRLGLSSW
jgi:hypothetical protein